MKSLQVKICGMREKGNIDKIAALKPDFMGFIFHPESPRYVGEDFNARWISMFHPEVRTVGVFVNQEVTELKSLVKRNAFNVIQLHGDESVAYCKEVREMLPDCEIWKAFPVGEKVDFSVSDKYHDVCDGFLFDTSSLTRGGSGKSFDWELLKDYGADKKVILSGGLGPENIEQALQLAAKCTFIRILDINSKIEINPGRKSVQLVQGILDKVRA